MHSESNRCVLGAVIGRSEKLVRFVNSLEHLADRGIEQQRAIEPK